MNYVKKTYSIILISLLSLSNLNGQESNMKKPLWDKDYTYKTSLDINFKLLALDFEANLKEMSIEGKTRKNSNKITEFNLSTNYETTLTDPDSEFAGGTASRTYSDFVLNNIKGASKDSEIVLNIKATKTPDWPSFYYDGNFEDEVALELNRIFRTPVNPKLDKVTWYNKEENKRQTSCVFSSEFISKKLGEFLNKELKDFKRIGNNSYEIEWKRPTNNNIPLTIIEGNKGVELLGNVKTALQRELYMLACPEIYKEYIKAGKTYSIDASLLKDLINPALKINFGGNLSIVCEELKDAKLPIKTEKTVNGIKIKIAGGILDLFLDNKNPDNKNPDKSTSYIHFDAPENECEVWLDESNQVAFVYLKIAKVKIIENLSKIVFTGENFDIKKLDFSLEITYLQSKENKK